MWVRLLFSLTHPFFRLLYRHWMNGTLSKIRRICMFFFVWSSTCHYNCTNNWWRRDWRFFCLFFFITYAINMARKWKGFDELSNKYTARYTNKHTHTFTYLFITKHVHEGFEFSWSCDRSKGVGRRYLVYKLDKYLNTICSAVKQLRWIDIQAIQCLLNTLYHGREKKRKSWFLPVRCGGGGGAAVINALPQWVWEFLKRPTFKLYHQFPFSW